MHLSDIHFRKGCTGDIHDENKKLRHELGLDLRRLRTELPRFDGLLVSGDIAYGGKPEEYDYARNWLESIRELVECDHKGVMVTPGNHDIDRSLIPVNGEIDLLQGEIRGAGSIRDCDNALTAMLRDPLRGASLLLPLSAYNAFAEQYGCRVTRDCPYWQRDFPLRDGTVLRVCGLTTTLISGLHDHLQTHKMIYGAAQQNFLREPNVRLAIIGHHPPSWTLEGDDADRVFSTLTAFQTFGHKHDQWITPLGNGVRLIAGAIHPDRRETQWQPRYAAIAITTIDDRHLKLEIYPRRWSDEEFLFMADYNSQGKKVREYTVTVEARQPNLN